MLSEIPHEILVKILSNLSLKDLLQLSCVCSNFRSATEIVYQNLRNKIRGQLRQNLGFLNFHDVRSLLLSKYGYTVGLWKIVSTVYGGLVKVRFDGFRLIGTRYFAPAGQDVDGPLRQKNLFIIDVDDQGIFECICLRGNNGYHSAEISQFEQDGFQLNCKDSDIHRLPLGPSVEFDLFLRDEFGIEKVEEMHRTDLKVSKYETLSKEFVVKCRPLRLPQHQDADVIIRPGLFKGTYSGHGIELVLLSYDDGYKSAVVTKISGDPNVPAGEVTIKPDLNRPVLESEDLATSGQSDSLPLSSSGLPVKRFQLLNSFYARAEVVPEFYLQRFSSKGQVAFTGFIDASYIDGEWVIFDNDTFGHLWFMLHAFSIYKRVAEPFTV